MSDDLHRLAATLKHAASIGGTAAGESAVHAGALEAETGLRVPGRAGNFAVTGLGGLQARVAMAQRHGVFQERGAEFVAHISTTALADTMADVAASAGAAVLK